MNKPKKREVIKNIAIVFLVIMLILTFFSNTIMNRTLPEVNTQSVTSGPVTTQVRGDGVVEAEDPYNVVCDETRKIKSVVKHVGDHVDIDDVLFLLEGETSEELTTAKNDLETAKSDYDLEILNSGLTQAEIASVEAGVTATTSSILASLEAKDNEINSLKSQDEDYTKKIADIDKQLELMGYTPVDTNTEAEAKAVEDAQNALNAAIETRDAYLNAQKAVESKINAQTAYEDSKKAYDEADEKLKAAQSDFDKADYDYTVAKNDYYSKNDIFNATVSTDPEYETRKKDKEDAYAVMEEKGAARSKAESALNEAKKNKENAKSVMDSALNTYNEAVSLSVIVPTEDEINNAKADVAAKEEALKKAKDALNNKKNNASSNDNKKNDLEKQKIELKSKQSEVQSKLEKLENDRKEYLTSEQTKINIEKKYQDVLKKEKAVKDLEAKALGGEIKSPVAGEITSVAYTAGEKVEAGSTVAVIQIDGKGYKLTFPVTAKQAKAVKVGDEVSVVNNWYYGDLKANLVAIQPDKNNTRDGKVLVFSLTGESVQPGQNLTLSVGEKSSNYDLVVPLSALREDTNGNFVLILETKSTPFGSRYVAKRVDVKVLAEDDKVAAVDGELMGWEYVITNASKHIENKDQVKLADK